MRVSEIRIQNYRTVCNLHLKFPKYYTAICGRNDAGKSNIVRMLRSNFQPPERIIFFPRPEATLQEDFPKWLERETPANQRFIQVDYTFQISRQDDEGLHRFLQDYLGLPETLLLQDAITLVLSVRQTTEDKGEQIALSIDNTTYETVKAQEVYKRLRSSLVMLFHDSTEFSVPFQYRHGTDLFEGMSGADETKVKEARAFLNKALTRVAKKNQQDLTEMLGRLKEKYRIGLSILDRDSSEVPYTITLGTDDGDVELDNWGSGTQNRTRILMTLFKARQMREAQSSTDKITPIIVVEEPESYLHPSAQAEFGRTLRDLAEELKVQVIVTTHSPYLLSLEQPDANILLARRLFRKRLRETEVVPTDSEKWMEPFSLALGISDSELAPWKDALFSSGDSVLLVEGDIDKEYLEMLRDDSHGAERLAFQGTIFPYGGKDTLKQRQLVRFVMSQFKTFLITYDLDCELEVEPVLKSLGLVKGVNYVSIGRDVPGKRFIEGLLPESVFQKVHADNVDLLQKATFATGSDSKSAKSSLKRMYLDEFKKSAKPGAEMFKNFYVLGKQLNKMISKPNGN